MWVYGYEMEDTRVRMEEKMKMKMKDQRTGEDEGIIICRSEGQSLLYFAEVGAIG